MRVATKARDDERETRVLRAFLLFVGLDLGAGVFEECVVIPRWAAASTARDISSELEGSGHLTAGHKFWPFVGILTLALTAANVIAAARSRGPRRPAWLTCAVTVAACDAMTVRYFVPTLHTLRSGQLSDVDARRLARRWVARDRARLAMGTAAFLAGLAALSRPGIGTRGATGGVPR